MLIDPFTVIAQIVNFAILAFLLKHFLYDRVIDAMDRREASIAERLSEAEQREATAHVEAAQLGTTGAVQQRNGGIAGIEDDDDIGLGGGCDQRRQNGAQRDARWQDVREGCHRASRGVVRRAEF